MSLKHKKEKDGYLRSFPGAKTSAAFAKVTKKLSNLPSTHPKEKEWYIFTLAFLKMAENGCDNILAKKLIRNNKYLTIGIIYNLKHGLEVIIKAFSRTINLDFDKSDQYHDLKILFKSFKDQKKLKNKNKSLDNELNKLEKIIEKYYELSFVNDYLRNSFKISDKKNTFFKYPENLTEIVVDYSNFLGQINKSDIENIKNDINEIIKISNKIKKFIR